MTIFKADGTEQTKAQVTTNLGTAITQEAQYTVDQDYYEAFRLDGQKKWQGGRRLKWKRGQVIKQSEFDAAFPTATFTSITPATGTTAGGTSVTIKGTNLSNATGVTFGGTAATSFKVVDDSTVTCVTPAKTAGAVNVVIQDDSGDVTATNAYTYA